MRFCTRICSFAMEMNSVALSAASVAVPKYKLLGLCSRDWIAVRAFA